MRAYSLICLLLLLLGGCASLSPEDRPVIQVSELALEPSSGAGPTVRVGLRVQNRSREPLTIEGLVYSLELEGHELFSGVERPQRTIAPYAEESFQITLASDLMGFVMLVKELYQHPKEELEYELNIKLDTGNPLLPALRHAQSGTLELPHSGAL